MTLKNYKFILSSFYVILFFSAGTAYSLHIKNGKVQLESLEDYDLCQTRDYDGNICQQALSDWVVKNPKDSFIAGKMTRRKMGHWLAVPFFTRAWTVGDGNCEDEDVKLAVLSALKQSPEKKQLVKEAIDIAFNKCKKQFIDDTVSLAKVDTNALKNTCKILIKNNALSGVAAKKCLKL